MYLFYNLFPFIESDTSVLFMPMAQKLLLKQYLSTKVRKFKDDHQVYTGSTQIWQNRVEDMRMTSLRNAGM